MSILSPTPGNSVTRVGVGSLTQWAQYQYFNIMTHHMSCILILAVTGHRLLYRVTLFQLDVQIKKYIYCISILLTLIFSNKIWRINVNLINSLNTYGIIF